MFVVLLTSWGLPWVVVARHAIGSAFTHCYCATEDQARTAARVFELDYPPVATEVVPSTPADIRAAKARLAPSPRWETFRRAGESLPGPVTGWDSPDPDGRYLAAALLLSIAGELGVTPNTLGQFATASGPYQRDPKRTRSDRVLPLRFSPAGEAIAARVYEACAPWNPHYLGERVTRILSTERAPAVRVPLPTTEGTPSAPSLASTRRVSSSPSSCSP